MSPIEDHISQFRAEKNRITELLQNEELRAEKVVTIVRLVIVSLLLAFAIIQSLLMNIPGSHYILPYTILFAFAIGFLLEVLFMAKTGRFKKFQKIYKYVVITVDIVSISLVMIHTFRMIDSQFPNPLSLATTLSSVFVVIVTVLHFVNLYRFNIFSCIYLGILGILGLFLGTHQLMAELSQTQAELFYKTFWGNTAVIILITTLSIFLSSFFRKVIIKSKKQEKLERFLPEVVAQQILSGTRDMEIGGEKRKVTILFSDIRNFTSYSEKNEPEDVINFLNSYFNDMISIIFRYNGSLDKIIGDGIMALFGVPFSHGNEEEQAVLAARDMLTKLEDFNQIRQMQGLEEIRIGIGIHSGEAIIGNVGCEQRMDFTAIGDAVNTASRLQDLTKKVKSPLLYSRNVMEALPQHMKSRIVGKAQLKGKADKIDVFCPE